MGLKWTTINHRGGVVMLTNKFFYYFYYFGKDCPSFVKAAL